jgi:hypothetical protein
VRAAGCWYLHSFILRCSFFLHHFLSFYARGEPILILRSFVSLPFTFRAPLVPEDGEGQA